jgi:ElaB/YqjD/DUF883 family membrane-anchored ribosome-binding protein
MSHSSSSMREGAREFGEKAGRMAESAKRGARDMAEQAQEQGEEALRDITNFVRERPLTSIGIAFGAGWLLAKLRVL